VDTDEAIDAIPEVVKILKSFDPAIPNDLMVYFGLKFAQKLGIHEIGTGDGSDNLFGGYSFMEEMADLEAYIHMIAEKMHFSSNELGDFFGIRIIQPFMSKEVMDYALRIPAGFKIRRENGKVWGKWILRKAFENLLPGDMIWQGKRPLECGSGMSRLCQVISERVSDEEFRWDFRPVKLINKEHLYYYKIYREYVGEIPKPGDGEKTCPGCGAGINMDGFNCKICGRVMDWRV
jgi:asparagine synthase (glutamine-hydrolysing)